MPSEWPDLTYEGWSATCDTLHAHTQVLGKLAVALAPPEPQLQHAALRLTARGWETLALPAPDRSGAIVAALDLHTHEAVIEHSAGHETRIALTPNRPVAEVTRAVVEAVGRLGGDIEINPTPQEVPWQVPLDQDHEHATYDTGQVATYFEAATRAALVLGEFRAPFRGRSTPVNAWWGTFDLAVSSSRGERPIHRPTTSSCATEAMLSRSRSGGGRVTRTTSGRHSSPSHTRRPMASQRRTSAPLPRVGTGSSASMCSIGRTSARAPIRMPSRWNSPGRRSATPVRCASGTRRWRPPQRVFRLRSGDGDG